MAASGSVPASTATQAKAAKKVAPASFAGLSADAIREAYEVALETRASIVTTMSLKTRGEGVEFWIGGPGEEVHGVATALACDQVVRVRLRDGLGVAKVPVDEAHPLLQTIQRHRTPSQVQAQLLDLHRA